LQWESTRGTRGSGRSFETDEVRQLNRIYLIQPGVNFRTSWPLRSKRSMEGRADGDPAQLAGHHHGHDRSLHRQLGQYQCSGG